MPVELWEKVMDANVRGEWLMAKAFGTRLIERGARGKVIMVSSTKGRHGSPAGYTAYSTSKGATDALVRVLATEWGKHGINVNAIAPTVFRSSLTAWIFEDTERGPRPATRNLSRLPLGRLGEPEDLLGISIYLLSAASDFCTGQVVYVDGGFTGGHDRGRERRRRRRRADGHRDRLQRLRRGGPSGRPLRPDPRPRGDAVPERLAAIAAQLGEPVGGRGPRLARRGGRARPTW